MRWRAAVDSGEPIVVVNVSRMIVVVVVVVVVGGVRGIVATPV